MEGERTAGGAAAAAVDSEPERGAKVMHVLRGVLWVNLAVVALKLLAFVSSQALSVVAEAVISRGPLRKGALALLGRRTHPMDTLIAITGDLAPVRSLLRPTVWLRCTRSVEARARRRP